METFTEPRAMVDDPCYAAERTAALETLDMRTIDPPIVDVIRSLATLPYCFTLQSCCGHFVCTPEQGPQTLDPVPASHHGAVRYRIAYLAVCLENGPSGRALLEAFQRLAATDPEYVQVGSADWFWERRVNSYALQVEPRRYMTRDEVMLETAEALRVQQARDSFFRGLRQLLPGE